MRGNHIVMGAAILGLATGARADEIKGAFHFGKTRFTPRDAIAFQVDGKEPGKPMTVVVLTDFKIDRPAALAAIDTTNAIIGQIYMQQSGNAAFVTLATEGQCGVSGFFEGFRSVGLGERFTAKTTASTASRVAGTCATDEPGKMFDDTYDFRLSFDLPVTAIPKPTTLPAGGGEPGAAYLALVAAIQAADFRAASRHLPADQVRHPAPTPSEAKDYFHGLALNYPQTAKVTGGLVKGDLARVEVEGVNYEGKRIKGGVAVRKTAGVWQVVDQSYYFVE